MPISRYRAGVDGRDGIRRARPTELRRATTGATVDRSSAGARDEDAGGVVTGRPGAPPGPRPRPGLAHPAAERRPAAARSRSRSRAIQPNPHQPRKRFDAEELASLTESISEHGVLQPILVTETIDGYQLVAGERRLRAAQAAGLERIPAVVRQLADREQLELALVENLQREDLDPLETAEAYRQLIDEFGFTQDDVAHAGRAGALDGREHASTARPRARRPGRGRRRAIDRGPRPRARRPADRAPGPRPRFGHRPGAVRPPDRGARPAPARAEAGAAGTATRGRRIPTSSASRKTSGGRSGPRSASPVRAAAAGSSSSTTATKSSGGSTSA